MGSIFLLQEGERLVEMSEKPYDSEDLLQALIANHPSILAGLETDGADPRRWVLVARELAVGSEPDAGGRWSLDHLFLDQDGVPTLVEVKRGSDTRIRREVVGQMLDYAANGVVYWPVEALRAQFEGSCQRRNVSPDDELNMLLGPDGDPEAFWQIVKTNLQAGRIRMVFVADAIPPELRRVLEFLNRQMDPAEVLALEIRQYVGQNLRTLVPLLVGTVTRRESGLEVRARGQWDEQKILESLREELGEAEAVAARRLFQWGRSHMPRQSFGTGAQNGSFAPVLDFNNKPFYFFSIYTSGKVEIQFQYMVKYPMRPFDLEVKRKEFADRLNQIAGVNLPGDAIALRPGFRLAALTTDSAMNQFLQTMEWALAQVRSSVE